MAKYVYFGHYWFPGGRGNAYVTFGHPIESDDDIWDFKRRLAQIVGKPDLLLVSYQLLDTDVDDYLLPRAGNYYYIYFVSYYYQDPNQFDSVGNITFTVTEIITDLRTVRKAERQIAELTGFPIVSIIFFNLLRQEKRAGNE